MESRAVPLPVHLQAVGLLLASCGGYARKLVRKDKDDVSSAVPECPPMYYQFLTTGKNGVLFGH